MMSLSRRRILGALAATATAVAMPSVAHAQAVARRNISSFANQRWQDHFDTLGRGAIVADTRSRALHFWGADGVTYLIYPSSVPMTEDLTKRGYTQIVRKRVGPSWTPTPSQMRRNPDWKPIPPGPANPLGTHAMYLSWPAYIIHGTHDTRKIGRPSSDGCFGLYNEKIEELFGMADIGTQVRVI